MAIVSPGNDLKWVKLLGNQAAGVTDPVSGAIDAESFSSAHVQWVS